jgi:hypothetical protein
LAVLLAQQTALAHDFWHAAGAASQGDAKPAKGKSLCDLHDLLGTVLGAVSSTLAAPRLLPPSVIRFCGDFAAFLQSRPLAAHSRGPPALS